MEEKKDAKEDFLKYVDSITEEEKKLSNTLKIISVVGKRLRDAGN
jgi:hypothetical protein